MERSALAVLGILIFGIVTPSSLRAQGPGFIFEFASASSDEIQGVSGKPYGPFEILAAILPLRLQGIEGPQGWSIAVTHDPREPVLELVQVTISGTTAERFLDRQDGFLHIEIIDPAKNGGKEGYVAAAILSMEKTVYLPPDRLSTVVSATYRGIHPSVAVPTETPLNFWFLDGLVGSADPVVNNVSYLDGSFFPDFIPLSKKLKTDPSCNMDLSLKVDAVGSVEEGEDQILRVDLPAGQDLLVESTVKLTSGISGTSGAEGWSLSVQHDPPFFELIEATTDGTDADLLADPENRIMKTQIVNGDQGAGFISAVVLSTITLRFLPPVGEFTIAKARYRLAAPHDLPGKISTTPIRFQDGLREFSEPVPNIITVEGKSEDACMKRALKIEVDVVPGGKTFLRGDANNDSAINISDAIWIVQGVFRGGSPSACPASADSNGDLEIDVTDIIFLFRYLFDRGEAIPPPFPRCAPDPIQENPLPCEESQVKCP